MEKPMLKPLGDRVLILPEPKEEKTSTGIMIPAEDRKPTSRGTIAAVGPGTSDYEMQTKHGDTVIFSTMYANEVITDQETEYVVMRERDVSCIVELENQTEKNESE